MSHDDTPALERHLHWEFAAFDYPRDHVGDMHWAISVTVIGYESERDAEIAAAAIVTRQSYKLRRVYECTSCGFNSRVVENQRRMTEVVAKISE